MQTLTHEVFKLNPPGGLFNETVVTNLFPDRSKGARELLLDRAIKAEKSTRQTRSLHSFAKLSEERSATLYCCSLIAFAFSCQLGDGVGLSRTHS